MLEFILRIKQPLKEFMTISQHETCRLALDGLCKIIDCKDGDSLSVHSFGVRVSTGLIKNEANLIGGENIGGSAEKAGVEKSSNNDDGGSRGSSQDQSLKAKRPTARPVRNGLPSEGLVRLPEILAAIPISKSGWYAGVKLGRYPSPVKLGPRTAAWRVSEIRALIEA